MAENTKMWSSEDGTPIRLTLEGGGVAVVGEEPRLLPPQFHMAAKQAGCTYRDGPVVTINTVTNKVDPTPVENDLHARMSALVDLIVQSLHTLPEGFMTVAGVPNAKWLSTQMGFTIQANERDAAWSQAQLKMAALRKAQEEL